MTRCETCGKSLPPESDPRIVAYCSGWCYRTRETEVVPIVHIHQDAEGAR